jgi:hypothetical protein
MEGQNLKQLESNREHLRNAQPPRAATAFSIPLFRHFDYGTVSQLGALERTLENTNSSVGVPLLRWGHGRVDHHDASPLHRSVDLAHPNFVISAMKQEGGGLSCPAESQLAVLARNIMVTKCSV